MATKRRRRKSEARGGGLPLRTTTTTRRTTAIRSPLDGDRFAHEREEPFRVTFFKVGANLFLLCASAYVLYNVRSTLLSGTQRNGDGPSEAMYEASETTAAGEDDWSTEPARDEPPPPDVVVEADEHDERDAPPLFPEFDLGTEVDFDAYGIARNPLFDSDAATSSSSLKPFFRSAAQLREDFAYRCGGENAARFVLSRGSTTFSASNIDDDDDRDDRVEEGEGSGGGGGSPFDLVPDGVRRTARRIIRARTSKRPFKMSFGGYSSTAGYGNRHNASYPFVLQRILTEPMKAIGVDLVVTNAAMDGISAFPYGWCMDNHFGRDVDVVSWDFAGNELAGSIDSLESYLRRASTMERKPMLIVKDTERAVKRRELLQRYVKEGVLLDPLLIHPEPATKPFLDWKDERRLLPPGFVNFEDFDGPPGSPGKVRQNLSSKGHELIGYMIGMHVLTALELVAAMDLVGSADDERGKAWPPSDDPSGSRRRGRDILLPAPVSKSAAIGDERDDGEASSMLFGEPLSNSPNPDDREGRTSKWTMNPVHCRTSFEPIIGGSGSLDEIIVSGTIAEDIDVLLPKGPMIYNQGWTFDLSPTVKSEKKKLKRWEDSLGFQDWKKAYYGVAASGTMRLHVPYVNDRRRGAAGRGKKERVDDDDDIDIQILGSEGVGGGVVVNASSFFKSLVVCDAASEIRGTDECDMERDVSYVVGGAMAGTVRAIDNDAVSYLGKKSCVRIGVPPGAIMTTRAEMTEGDDDGKNVREPAARRSKENDGAVVVDSDEKEAARRRSLVGVSLEISVSSPYVTWKKGPCSVSHVVWEERVR